MTEVPSLPRTALRRRLGFWLLAFYGLGNILGAGIYVLVGQVAGHAQLYAPLSFLAAALVAGFTALTYAELSARFPVAAGVAIYVHEGFGIRGLSLVVGIAMACAGMFSAATLARGFAGYAEVFLPWPEWRLIALLIVALTALAVYGIAESLRVAALFTLAELAGLLLIIAVGAPQLGHLPDLLASAPPLTAPATWSGILLGAFLAFYAFLGFEDMVNVAEEAKDPRRDMPRAILSSLLVALLLYAGVALVSVATLRPAELAATEAPLAEVYRRATGDDPLVITGIALFAVVNGALVQIIMASRIFYGMARRGWLPGWLARVGRRTGTPVTATLAVGAAILLLALRFPLVRLAEFTSYVTLGMFMLVNLALLRIRRRPAPPGVRVYPGWVPVAGFLGAAALLVAQLWWS